MIAKLLATRRKAANHGAPGQLEVGALKEGIPRHEEELLLHADVHRHFVRLPPTHTHTHTNTSNLNVGIYKGAN